MKLEKFLTKVTAGTAWRLSKMEYETYILGNTKCPCVEYRVYVDSHTFACFAQPLMNLDRGACYFYSGYENGDCSVRVAHLNHPIGFDEAGEKKFANIVRYLSDNPLAPLIRKEVCGLHKYLLRHLSGLDAEEFVRTIEQVIRIQVHKNDRSLWSHQRTVYKLAKEKGVYEKVFAMKSRMDLNLRAARELTR